MLPQTILYRGETKTITFTLKSNGAAVAFSSLDEVTVLVLINRVLQKKYTKTGGTVQAVAGSGNENKCSVTLAQDETKYYPLGALQVEFVFPAGSDLEVENSDVFFVKDSAYSRQ